MKIALILAILAVLLIKRSRIAALVASGYLASEALTYLGFGPVQELMAPSAMNILLCLGCTVYWGKYEIPNNLKNPTKSESIGAWMVAMSFIACFLSFSKLAVLGVMNDYKIANAAMGTLDELLVLISMATIALLLILPQKKWGLHELATDISNGFSRLSRVFNLHIHNEHKT